MTSPSTPLPEQGGFNERLDSIMQELVVMKDYAKARTAIRTLVLEEIIGEDEQPGVFYSKNSKINLRPRYKNQLRAEQRLRLGGTHGTK